MMKLNLQLFALNTAVSSAVKGVNNMKKKNATNTTQSYAKTTSGATSSASKGAVAKSSYSGAVTSADKKPYYNPGKERSKLEKKIKKAEEELAIKEEKLEGLKQELLNPMYQSSYSKLTEIQGQIDDLEEEIMADMEVWEELSSQLDELQN